MICLTDIWRHPIKGLGRERLEYARLYTEKTLPWDRHWAIAHKDAKIDYDNPIWARCLNFARAARGHKLMAASCKLDDTSGNVTLTHPELPTICVNPDNPNDADVLVNWVSKISDPKRSMPAAVYKAPDRGMTDSSTASLSLHTKASLDALSQAVGAPLDQRRFRGNLWLDGAKAWDEFNWLGKSARIGDVEFQITKRIERCVATTINPDTGISDQETLAALKSNWGHQDFGVQAVVTKPGRIQLGNEFELL